MAWSEEDRKRIWGKKYNPALLMGLLLLIVAGWIGRVAGLIIMFYGFKLYKKYK